MVKATSLLATLRPRGLDETGSSWSGATLAAHAAYGVDNAILGMSSELVRGDAHQLWRRWFLEGLCDVTQLVQKPRMSVRLHLQRRLEELGILGNATEISDLVDQLDSLLWSEICRAKEIDKKQKKSEGGPASRSRIPEDVKLKVWDLAGEGSAGRRVRRCAYCRTAFSKAAEARFVTKTNVPVESPLYVDYLTGRGSDERHACVEFDHVRPVFLGGEDTVDNVRLACGWCNAVKREFSLIYDVGARDKPFRHPQLGRVHRPHEIWVLRLLATSEHCDSRGCRSQGEMLVSPRSLHGRPNPTNLRVTCLEHDPIRDYRFVPLNDFRKQQESGGQ
jgi:hypothetical protein